MPGKAPTVKSVLGRGQPRRKIVSELAGVSASPTPAMAFTRSEATSLNSTVGRVKSRVQIVETGFEKGVTSKLGKHRVNAFDPHHSPALESTRPQSAVLLPLVGP